MGKSTMGQFCSSTTKFLALSAFDKAIEPDSENTILWSKGVPFWKDAKGQTKLEDAKVKDGLYVAENNNSLYLLKVHDSFNPNWEKHDMEHEEYSYKYDFKDGRLTVFHHNHNNPQEQYMG